VARAKRRFKEVSHIYYEDEDCMVEVKDRADAIEKGLNKGVKHFKIIEETEWFIRD